MSILFCHLWSLFIFAASIFWGHCILSATRVACTSTTHQVVFRGGSRSLEQDNIIRDWETWAGYLMDYVARKAWKSVGGVQVHCTRMTRWAETERWRMARSPLYCNQQGSQPRVRGTYDHWLLGPISPVEWEGLKLNWSMLHKKTLELCRGILDIGLNANQTDSDENATHLLKGGVMIWCYRGGVQLLHWYKNDWVAALYVYIFGEINFPKSIIYIRIYELASLTYSGEHNSLLLFCISL